MIIETNHSSRALLLWLLGHRKRPALLLPSPLLLLLLPSLSGVLLLWRRWSPILLLPSPLLLQGLLLSGVLLL